MAAPLGPEREWRVAPTREHALSASSFDTRLPGDILLTGTPEGVGLIGPGDVMDVRIEHIGAMRVAVEAGAGAV